MYLYVGFFDVGECIEVGGFELVVECVWVGYLCVGEWVEVQYVVFDCVGVYVVVVVGEFVCVLDV